MRQEEKIASYMVTEYMLVIRNRLCLSEISKKKKKKKKERERPREKSGSPPPLGRVLLHDYSGPIVFPTYTTTASLSDLLGTKVLCNTALTWGAVKNRG